jgi:peptide/nickel transport system substrate-binding protein
MSPHSRRSFFALSAGALLGLAGCGGVQRLNTSGPPRKGGTLRFAVATQADSWDPHVAATDITAVLLRPVFDSLVSYGADGTFRPWLATGWSVSPDGLAYTFRLREDVTFSDGEPFNAAAVRDNLAHILDPATKSGFPLALLGPLAKVDVTGEHTVVLRMSEPYSSLLYALSTTYLGFHSPRALREHGKELASGRFLTGTGPFTLESVVPNQEAVFRRRPGYRWPSPGSPDPGESYVDGYRVSFLPEDQTRVGAVGSGQVDVADEMPSARLSTLRKQAGMRIEQNPVPGSPYSYYLNVSRPPFDDPAVRRAVQASIDLDAIVKGVFRGEYQRAWSVLTPKTQGYAADLAGTWGYSPETAARLLDGAGYSGRDGDGYRVRGGVRLRAEFPFAADYSTADRRTFDVALQDSLRKAGIEVVLTAVDSAEFASRVIAGEYDVKAVAWGSADPAVLRELFHSKRFLAEGGSNQGRVRDPRLDAWLDAARATLDPHEQSALYSQVQHRVIEQAYAIPAYTAPRSLALAERVRGVRYEVSGTPALAELWLADS